MANKRKPPPMGSASGSRVVDAGKRSVPKKYAPKKPSARAIEFARDHDAPLLQALRTRTVARRCSLSEEHAKTVAELAFGDGE